MLSQNNDNSSKIEEIQRMGTEKQESPDYYTQMDIIDDIQYSCKEGDELIWIYSNLVTCVETVEISLLGNFVDSGFLQSVINDFMKENDDVILAYIRKFIKTLIVRLEKADYDHEVIIDLMASQIRHTDFGQIASIALAKIASKSKELHQSVLKSILLNFGAFSSAELDTTLPLFSSLIKGEVPEELIEYGIQTNDPRFFVIGSENPRFHEVAGIDRIYDAAITLLNEEEFARQSIVCLSKLLLAGHEIEIDVRLISNYFMKDIKTSTAALFVVALASERDRNAALCASTVFDPEAFIDAPFHVQREAARLTAVLVIALQEYFYKERAELIVKFLVTAIEYDDLELQDLIIKSLIEIGESSIEYIDEDIWEQINQLSDDLQSASHLLTLRGSF